MKNGKLTGFTCFQGDCRCSGRQTIGNGSPFNPDLLLAYYRLKHFKDHCGTCAQPLISLFPSLTQNRTIGEPPSFISAFSHLYE